MSLIDLPLETSPSDGKKWDPNPFFGRVLYTHALGIDRPQSIIRLAYRTRLDTTRAYPLTNLLDFVPIPIVPLWDARGQPDIGMFAHVGAGDNCQTVNSRSYCSRIIWPGKYFAYERPPGAPLYWHGSLIDDKRDPIGTHYRRNRYYDPKSGRFTQEDPIGLAGGLNLYGYADGDPVSFSDPFGLLPIPLLIVGAVALFEAASTAYDVYSAGKTLFDPNASGSDKSIAVAGAVAGVWTPGPGTAYARGGTYILRNADGQVMRTGRTNDLARRRAEHARNPETRDLEFEVDRRTDDAAQQRGREQVIHDQHNPPLNKVNPISPKNPRRQEYLDAAKRIQ